MKKHCLYVNGTHCSSCKILIEETLIEHSEVSGVSVDLYHRRVEIETDRIESPEELAKLLNPLLSSHNYILTTDEKKQDKNWKNFTVALPIGLLVLILFFLLQKSGVLNFGFEGNLTPWTALLIGLVASISTCLAVVGGLILSLSAKISQGASSFKPFTLFHIGRIVSFAILGAMLGLLGEAISINQTVTAILGLLATLVMIILGINLLDVFHLTKKFQFTLPTSIFKKISKIEDNFFAPALIGAATFFLPCGFTQSMQISALAGGSWLQGGMIMLMFSLGTLPVLLLISLSSYKFAHGQFASLFYRSAGVVVIGLGVFSFLSGLAGLGIIRPLFNI